MKKIIFAATLIFIFTTQTFADCALDHLVIGINRDGIFGTDDDDKLFVDCEQKYRHSGTMDYENWHYPLNESIFIDYKYRIAEPGFGIFQSDDPTEVHSYDPNRCPVGNPNVDYRIIVECLSISPGLRVVHSDYPQFTIDEAGESFNHSEIHQIRGEGHMHLSYQAIDDVNLFWVSFVLYDSLDDGYTYQASEPFTIVFNIDPLQGDLFVDRVVDSNDLLEFCYYWQSDNGSTNNDYYERADIDRSGTVEFIDFAKLANNWLETLP